MDYKILPYSFDQAKKLGVTIKPSTKKDKKIDVFKGKELIHSIGAKGYKDYPTYVKEKGKEVADERRLLYKSRHKKNLSVTGSKGWYADKILW
jgi:phage gp16-like protein